MANLNLKKEIDTFNQLIKDRQERISLDYTKFFSKKPAFVTYYNQNQLASTYESSLDDTVGLLGEDSPIRFNKIEEFPLYNFSGTDSVSEDETDFGLNTVIEGEAVIIPQMIQPYEEDFFVVTHDSEKHVFKVNNVEIDRISGHKFFKISFALIQQEESEIIDKVTEEYIVDYDNIGTQHKSVIPTTDYVLLNSVNDIYDMINDFFVRSFYHEGLNFFYFEVNGAKTYDPVATIFAKNHKLFEKVNKKDILDSIFLDEIVFNKEFYKTYIRDLYNTSIFYCLENKVQNPFARFFTAMDNPNTGNELDFESDHYDVAALLGDTYEIFDQEFVDHFVSGTVFGDPSRLYEDYIIDYMIGHLKKDEIIERTSQLNFTDDYKDFYKMLTVLFILVSFRNNIIK